MDAGVVLPALGGNVFAPLAALPDLGRMRCSRGVGTMNAAEIVLVVVIAWALWYCCRKPS